jgi:nucleoside-diphosphate kinase
MFLEVYDSVLKEYFALVKEFSSGPIVALALSSSVNSVDVVHALRELCGPQDVGLAKRARPESLRARYAVDQVRKAVHCSDIEEFGPIDVSVPTFDVFRKSKT